MSDFRSSRLAELATQRSPKQVASSGVVIIKSRWLLPVTVSWRDAKALLQRRPNGGTNDGLIIDHGAIAIRMHRIVSVGKFDDVCAAVEKQFGTSDQSLTFRVVDLSEKHLVMPGLINCHTHGAMNMFRGAVDDYPLDIWLKQYMWPLEEKFVNPETVFLGSAAAAIESITHGTTTLNDMYYFPEQALRAFRDCGVRAVVGAPFIESSSTAGLALQTDQGHNFVQKVFADWWKAQQDTDETSHGDPTNSLHRLTTASLAPHSLESVTVEELQRIAGDGMMNENRNDTNSDSCFGDASSRDNVDEAQKLDVDVAPRQSRPSNYKQPLIHMHLNEVKEHAERFERQHGVSPLEFLRDKAQLSSRFVLAHCVHTTPRDLEILSTSGANVCHCPTSNMKLASGFCSVRAMLDRGINVCLGTDGACTNNALDMIAEMSHAVLIGKVVSGDVTALDPYTAICMATRHGAQALGMLDKIGSLEAGKFADIIAIDLCTTPDVLGYCVIDPLSHLLYTRAWKVTDTWIDGRQVMSNGVVQDPRSDPTKFRALMTEIAEWTKSRKCAESTNSPTVDCHSGSPCS